MKYQGRIQQWDDAKGYGFVEPNGGGTRAFTHIKAFKQRSRRPVNGDIIVYEVEQDRNGNHRACNISLLKDHKAKRLRANKPTSQRKRNVIVLSIFSGALALFTLSGRLPFIVPIVYGAVSLLTILFYGIDKSAAKKEKRRVSEAKLHILSLLGGWPGALLAQQMSIPIRIDNCPLRSRCKNVQVSSIGTSEYDRRTQQSSILIKKEIYL
ncbi:MAG: DUF1294 domain-containing protein [Pseudomonadota bacterium]|nr:DUF1294 domain-containing protein [Pseudomonadota bacterium]